MTDLISNDYTNHATVISPKLLYNEVSKTVIGQEKAKRMICNVIFLHWVNYYRGICDPTAEIPKKPNAILLGPSGSGKTFIVREAVKALQKILTIPVCPLLEVDCTSLTATGWAGDTLNDALGDHYIRLGKRVEEFSSSIVFLDEVDKLCKGAVGAGGTDHNKQTQYDILKIVEGCEFDYERTPHSETIRLNSHKMLFIFAGNFSEYRDHVAEPNPFGFNPVVRDNVGIDIGTDLETIGMATQLVARINHAAELEYLTEAELTSILTEHVIKQYDQTWEFLGTKIKFPKREIKNIVERSLKRKTGARGLHSDVAAFVEKFVFEMELKI